MRFKEHLQEAKTESLDVYGLKKGRLKHLEMIKGKK